MILARVNTPHYTFEALASDEDEARRLLLQAWEKHCAQNPRAYPPFMSELVDGGEINFAEIELGQVLRDGSRIV